MRYKFRYIFFSSCAIKIETYIKWPQFKLLPHVFIFVLRNFSIHTKCFLFKIVFVPGREDKTEWTTEQSLNPEKKTMQLYSGSSENRAFERCWSISTRIRFRYENPKVVFSVLPVVLHVFAENSHRIENGTFHKQWPLNSTKPESSVFRQLHVNTKKAFLFSLPQLLLLITGEKSREKGVPPWIMGMRKLVECFLLGVEQRRGNSSVVV